MSNQGIAQNQPWTILKLLDWAASYFQSHHIDSPKATAEILLAHALDLKRIDLYLQYDRPLNKAELAAFKKLVLRRTKREPVAYIVGEKEFWSLLLLVSKAVLIPRPDTERLVEIARDFLSREKHNRPLRILDLGTGSGAIVLSLAAEHKEHHFFAGDISPAATVLAKQNAYKNNLDNIHFFAGDWLGALRPTEKPFDMIVSNPPYIPSDDIHNLQPEISRYEPLTALDAGPDGLVCLRHLIEHAWLYLRPGGHLILEMGYDQKDQVAQLADANGTYQDFTVHKDYAGHDRVVSMRRV